MGVDGQCHAPAALPQERDPIPILKEAVWDPTADLNRCGICRQLPVLNGMFLQQYSVPFYSVVGMFRSSFFQFLIKKKLHCGKEAE